MKVLIDCDPGHDDAAAILYAAQHLDLVGISTVYGNQNVESTTRNALKVCELGGLDVPVALGASRPWVAEPRHLTEAHGKTGLDGADLPEPSREPIAQGAVDLILEQAHKHQGELILTAVGPLTNVATALQTEPKLTSWFKAISIMGGSTSYGNVTPVAEFNIHADPEAAHAVFRSGVPLYMCGLNVTRQVGVTRRDIRKLRETGRHVASTFADLFEFYLGRLEVVFGLDSASLHDACALMPFIDDSLITYKALHVDVELASGLTRGMTVCDLRYAGSVDGAVIGGGGIQSGRQPNVNVALEVDHDRARKDVLDTLCCYP